MAAEGGDVVDVSVDTQHEDMVHDAQLDYYSRKLATCSSDRSIKIFEVGLGEKVTLLATLTGHEGPVWEVREQKSSGACFLLVVVGGGLAISRRRPSL